MILIAMSVVVTGFEILRSINHVPTLEKYISMLWDGPTREMLHDKYLFRFRKLCILHTSLRDFLSWELHDEGLAGHFSQNKTIESVEHRFYCPSLKKDVAKIVGQCRICQLAKQQKHVANPYTPLHVPNYLQ